MTPEQATVTELTDTAVTILIGSTSLTLPRTAVMGTPRVGAELRLLAVAPGSEDAGKTEIAQALLNELIGHTP